MGGGGVKVFFVHSIFIHWLYESSVVDPDPLDPYVFGPPGSGSFQYQAKIVRKTLISKVLWQLHDFLSLKNDENVPLKKQKN